LLINVASASPNCCGVNFTCYGVNRICCDNDYSCRRKKYNCHLNNSGLLRLVLTNILLRQRSHFLRKQIANSGISFARVLSTISKRDTEKNGFVAATKLGITNESFVASTKNFASATKRFVGRTKHFVGVTKYFCHPYFKK